MKKAEERPQRHLSKTEIMYELFKRFFGHLYKTPLQTLQWPFREVITRKQMRLHSSFNVNIVI